MRFGLVILICFVVFFLQAQNNSYTGVYTGKINGDFTQIEMQQTGTKVSGKYIESGNTYNLSGNVISNQLIGELIIAGTTTQLATFTANKNSNVLHMDLLLLGVTNVSGDFIKSNSVSSGAQPTNSNSASNSNGQSLSPPKDQFARDPAVIGNWIKEEVINSGVGDLGASLVTAYFLQFKGDGTFIQEKSSSAGGSNWSSVDQKTLDVSGHWYTRDQIMYVRPLGQNDYVRLNRYLFHEGALVFKTEAGKYLIWNKR